MEHRWGFQPPRWDQTHGPTTAGSSTSAATSGCNPHTSAADGTDEEPIEITGFEYTPTISDNGKRIAFLASSDIWVAKSDGTGVDNITETPGIFESDPDISPDGKSVAYNTYDDSEFDILRSKIDGSSVKPVLDGDADDRAPEWSPDGKRIAFHRLDGGVTDIFTVKKDGTGRKRLTDTADRSEANPSWSPDGKQIAFSQFFNMALKLKTVKATGGPIKNVKAGSVNPSVPSWSPNGKRLSFFASDGGQSDVFTIKLNGKGQRNITDDVNQDFFYD